MRQAAGRLDQAADARFDAAAEVERAGDFERAHCGRQARDVNQRLRELEREAGIAGRPRGRRRLPPRRCVHARSSALPRRSTSGHARMKNRFRLSRCVTCAHSCEHHRAHFVRAALAQDPLGDEQRRTGERRRPRRSGTIPRSRTPASARRRSHSRRPRACQSRMTAPVARQAAAARQAPRARSAPPAIAVTISVRAKRLLGVARARTTGRSAARCRTRNRRARAGQHAQTEQQRARDAGRVALEAPRQRRRGEARSAPTSRGDQRERDKVMTAASSQYVVIGHPPACGASRAPAARARPAAARPAGSLPRRRTTGWAARCPPFSSGCSARVTNPDSISCRELTAPVGERAADLAPLQHALPVQPLHRRHQRGVGGARETRRADRARRLPRRGATGVEHAQLERPEDGSARPDGFGRKA